LAVVLWLLMFVLMIIFCCRCCKLRRIDREIQDGKGFHYDQTGIAYKAAKHRRILWFGTLLIFLFYIACAGYAYKETLAVKTSFDKAYKGSDAFMTNLQNALCTLDGADTCADKSLGDFLHDVLGELTGVLDGILAWFLSLGSLSAPLSTIAAYYSTLSTQYTTVNASFVAGRAAKTNIAAVISKTEYSRYGLAVSLPTITNTNIAEFGGANDAISVSTYIPSSTSIVSLAFILSACWYYIISASTCAKTADSAHCCCCCTQTNKQTGDCADSDRCAAEAVQCNTIP
jgi:hypothetical protein